MVELRYLYFWRFVFEFGGMSRGLVRVFIIGELSGIVGRERYYKIGFVIWFLILLSYFKFI